MRITSKHIVAIILFMFIGISSYAQNKMPDNLETDCPIHTPNAFTPNGDGVNDFFYFTFQDNCIPVTFNLQIIDRWGRLVFETRDFQEKWDGTFNGQELKDGAYLWVMTSQVNVQDEVKSYQKKGTVVIIR